MWHLTRNWGGTINKTNLTFCNEHCQQKQTCELNKYSAKVVIEVVKLTGNHSSSIGAVKFFILHLIRERSLSMSTRRTPSRFFCSFYSRRRGEGGVVFCVFRLYSRLWRYKSMDYPPSLLILCSYTSTRCKMKYGWAFQIETDTVRVVFLYWIREYRTKPRITYLRYIKYFAYKSRKKNYHFSPTTPMSNRNSCSALFRTRKSVKLRHFCTLIQLTMFFNIVRFR